MAAGAKTPPPSTSLQRLLSLDKSFDNLDQRIEEAARILDLPAAPAIGSAVSDNKGKTHTARLEFVLRWLLDKLKSQPAARRSPPAWDLLRNILHHLPAVIISKALPGTNLLETLIQALGDIFPTQTAAVANTLPATDEGNASSKIAKKRKRNANDKDTQPSHHALPLHESQAIFANMASLLTLLIDYAEHHDTEAVAPVHNQIHALLSLANSAFADFLKHWLAALLLFVPATSSKSHDDFLDYCLKLVTRLLSLQPTNQTTAPLESFDTLFCRACASPAALLLARLHALTPTTGGSSLPATSNIHILERLLAQHMFVPARAAFHASRDNHPLPGLPAKSNKSRPHHITLSERLDPFRSEIIALSAESAAHDSYAHLLDTAQNSLPYLLDIALRCTPTATPKQKITEGPWIDAVVAALCSVLPGAVSASDVDPASVANQTVVAMLDVMLNRNLSLTSALLAKLIQDWSGLLRWAEKPLPTNSKTDFELVAKVLAMDPAMFTDIKSLRARALFEALTAHGKDAGNPHVTPSRQSLLCKSIAIPLMKAFARIRNLKGFVDQWSLELRKHSAWEEDQWFVWRDQTLQSSLRDVLETSLTLPQITELLESACAPLVNMTTQRANHDEDSSASDLLSHAAASAVILNAVVGAVHSDSAIDTLQATLRSLTDATQTLILVLGKGEDYLMASLLALTSRLYLLWFPVWSTTSSQEVIDGQLDAILESSGVQRSLTAIDGMPKEAAAYPPIVVDAAFRLIATVSDLLRYFPTRQDSVKELLSKVAFSQIGEKVVTSTGCAIPRPVAFFSSIAEFPRLLEYLPQPAREAVFQNLLRFASEDVAENDATTEVSVDAVVADANHAVRDDLFSAISQSLNSQSSSEAERSAARKLLLLWSSRGLARQQREKVLDLAVDAVLHPNATDMHHRLALIVNLLELPNATAKIATDASLVWQLASSFSAEEKESLTLGLFEETCNSLFKHIIGTKEQERSATFLADLSRSLATFMAAKEPIEKSGGKLRLLSAYITATESRLDSTLSELDHRSSTAVDAFTKYIYNTLSTSVESLDAPLDSRLNEIATAVRVFVTLPGSFQSNGGSSTSKYSKRIMKLLNTLLIYPDNKLPTANAMPTDGAFIPLSVQVACFARLASSLMGENAMQLCRATETLLLQELDVKQYDIVFRSVGQSAKSLSDTDKLSLITQLLTPTDSSSQVAAEKVAIARCLIVSLESPKDEETTSSVAVLTTVLELLRNCSVYETHCELADTVVTILRNKPALVTQYGTEMTIAALVHLTSPSSPSLPAKRSHTILEGLCSITRSLLQFHRQSLNGRYHIVVPLLQRLVSCLFTPATRDFGSTSRFKHPSWIDNRTYPMTVVHAQRVSRLLENLCNPPQSDVSRRRHDASHDLVDAARKARVQVSQHVQFVLHYVCTLILNGRLGEGMRDALTPGLWAVIDVVEIGADDSRGVKALSAGMSNAERAVLRSMFEEWRKFGSWSG